MSDGQNQEISPATAQVGPLPATDFPTIYRLLVKLDYRQQDEIQDLERQLYLLLKENPENINGLIILMQEQIMRGEHQKAKSLAYKIWDLGGEMSPALEALFISNLINLGLTDMAGILLKPKFDALNTYIKIFYPQLLKYAIATGNLNYIERIAVLDSNFETKKPCRTLSTCLNIWMRPITSKPCSNPYWQSSKTWFSAMTIRFIPTGNLPTLSLPSIPAKKPETCRL